MFYNTYRATTKALQNRVYSAKTLIDPRERLLNQPKRQKLKNLLMAKFIKKYNIKDPNEFLELVVTQFLQGEKLTDRDLQKLDIKISRLNKEFNNKNRQKSHLENLSIRPIQTDSNILINNINDKHENPNITEVSNIKNRNKSNQVINLKSEFPRLNECSNLVTKTESNIKKRGYSSYINRTQNNKVKNPEEELAELEKELAEEELLSKGNHKYKRIDFSSQGDEWNAILNYNKNLHKRLLLEEKMKDLEIKKRTKECLDIQIKEKIKKELDEQLQEKELDAKIQQHQKKLDEMDQNKLKKISEQIQRLKNDRDFILKTEIQRKKIEELKEKKLDNIIVKRYKEELAEDKKAEIERKKRGRKDLLKAKEEIEEKQKLIKEKIEKEKEEDRRINKLRNLMDQRKENERNLYYKRIRAMSNKYSLPNSNKILEQMKKDKKEEEEKIQHFYEEKNKQRFEKEMKDKIKRVKDKIEIKKFLDTQIQEKKKEQNYLKLLDKEQARIWKADLMKRCDEMKLEEEAIKKMNRKNFECILKQIEEKKLNKAKKNIMTENEYAINRNLLEKANEDYLKTNMN